MKNIRIKVCLLSNIHEKDVAQKISKLLFYSMQKNSELKKLHSENTSFKNYSFQGGFYPKERDGIYKEAEVYDFNIKCFSDSLSEKFINALRDLENDDMLVVDVDRFILKEGRIEKIYTLTPAVATLKDDNGKIISWIRDMGMEILENQMFNNMMKKFNEANKINIIVNKEDVIKEIIITNKYPIISNYKGGIVLGYKYEIYFKGNMIAQQIANFINVVGILSKNSSLGCGFTKAVYMKGSE